MRFSERKNRVTKIPAHAATAVAVNAVVMIA